MVTMRRMARTVTVEQIDEDLARLAPGREDPRCERWIDDLLQQRLELTEAQADGVG